MNFTLESSPCYLSGLPIDTYYGREILSFQGGDFEDGCLLGC
jgi:hypothetical protein